MPVARPNSFIVALPKAELHLHLEGTIDPTTLVELQTRHGESPTLREVEALYSFQDFTGFLMAFKAITEHLRAPEDYELITYRLMERLKAENVLHAEIFVSVGVCLWRKQNFSAIFEALERGRERGEKDFGISLLWILDAVRQFGPSEAQHVAEIAARFKDRHVAGFGIGGDERRAGPELFRDVFAYAADQGLRLTAHAGETTGPESIWGALNLQAERIGHGLSAFRDPELIEELSQRQIPLEVCITSNVRTGACPSVEAHPVRYFFDHGIMVTLSTDDPAMFRTSLCREYQLAQDAFGFTDDHLREFARNSFEGSFLPDNEKLKLFDLIDQRTPAR
jgi:adenosine deaminase/aminodeoxyfutalosine deaminase